MLHELIRTWFQWVEQWGYFGVFILMAMESSIIPVPSEIVMPPAAFWASQGKMNFWGVIAAGTLGSYFGSAVSYWVSHWVGLPFVKKFGKYVFISEKKFQLAEVWVREYGVPGIFVARLLPVVRHLISIPAGIFRMNFLTFSIVTIIGAGIWCAVLAWFGQKVLGDNPKLLETPEDMIGVMKEKLWLFVLGVVAIGALYFVVIIFKKRKMTAAPPS